MDSLINSVLSVKRFEAALMWNYHYWFDSIPLLTQLKFWSAEMFASEYKIDLRRTVKNNIYISDAWFLHKFAASLLRQFAKWGSVKDNRLMRKFCWQNRKLFHTKYVTWDKSTFKFFICFSFSNHIRSMLM